MANKLLFKLKEGRFYIVRPHHETALPERLRTPEDVRQFFNLTPDRAEFVGDVQKTQPGKGKYVNVKDYDGGFITYTDIDGKEQKTSLVMYTTREIKKYLAGQYAGAEIIFPQEFHNSVDEGNNDYLVIVNKAGYPEAVTENGTPIDTFPFTTDPKKIEYYLTERSKRQEKTASLEFVALP